MFVLRFVGTAIRNIPMVQRFIDAHPRLWKFVSERFRRDKPLGLRLTFGLACSFFFLFVFFGIVQDLIANDPLARADLRVLTLLQTYRAPAFDHVMLFITYLGNAQIVLAGAGLLSIYFALTRRWLWLAALVFSLAGEESVVWLTKALFARVRPDLVNALVAATGPSFPSGHAFVAVAFYGLVAWFAFDLTRSYWKKFAIAVLAGFGIAALGFSRVYLGVHWPSDVLASFAAGATWLSILVTALTVARARGVADAPQAVFRPGVLAGVLVVAWLSAVIEFYDTRPQLIRHEIMPVQIAVPENDAPAAIFAKAPRFSEDITGTPVEPINVIVIGTEGDLERVFADAHWVSAESITLGSSWRLMLADLFDRPDQRAPGLPVFWNGLPNDRAFERPTESHSARERHHLHLWTTPFTKSGVRVWLGTVHLDKKANLPGWIHIPIHEIDPAVDQERDALRRNLSTSPCVDKISETQIVQPMKGRNEIQNPFFTDGHAIVVNLKCK